MKLKRDLPVSPKKRRKGSSQFAVTMLQYVPRGPIAQRLEQPAHKKVRLCAFTHHAYRGRRHWG